MLVIKTSHVDEQSHKDLATVGRLQIETDGSLVAMQIERDAREFGIGTATHDAAAVDERRVPP